MVVEALKQTDGKAKDAAKLLPKLIREGWKLQPTQSVAVDTPDLSTVATCAVPQAERSITQPADSMTAAMQSPTPSIIDPATMLVRKAMADAAVKDERKWKGAAVDTPLAKIRNHIYFILEGDHDSFIHDKSSKTAAIIGDMAAKLRIDPSQIAVGDHEAGSIILEVGPLYLATLCTHCTEVALAGFQMHIHGDDSSNHCDCLVNHFWGKSLQSLGGHPVCLPS